MKFDYKKMESMIDSEEGKRQVPYIVTDMINKTLLSLRRTQKEELGRFTDKNPNPYTKNSSSIIFAKADRLLGLYGFGYRNNQDMRQGNSNYVGRLTRGGEVTPKKKRLVELNPTYKGKGVTKGGRLKKDFIKEVSAGQHKDFFTGTIKGRYGVYKRLSKSQRRQLTKAGKKDTPVTKMIDLEDTSRRQPKVYNARGRALKFIMSKNRMERQFKASTRTILRQQRSWLLNRLMRA